MKSWVPVPVDSDFSLLNIPFGIASELSHNSKNGNSLCSSHTSSSRHWPVTRVGDTVIRLGLLQEAGLFHDIILHNDLFDAPTTLNEFATQPQTVRRQVRERLQHLLRDDTTSNNCGDCRLSDNVALQRAAFRNIHQVQLHLPVQVGDYTDFYSSREHATNVGNMFRGKDNALQPNWLHLPVGYHGRASTIFVSPHDVRRPRGQIMESSSGGSDEAQPRIVHAPCKLLDFELEVATVVGGGGPHDDSSSANNPGSCLTIAESKERIFGFLLMNDWSARDIQKWEYVPLGPFTSKNFATTVSPWIITPEALEPYTAPTSAGPQGQTDPVPLDYLVDPDYSSYDVELTVAILPPASSESSRDAIADANAATANEEQHQQQPEPVVVSRSNFRNMYWNAAQQLTHHTVTGCIMKAGDLLGSGTISGSQPDSYGSMLELSWRGTRPVQLSSNDGGDNNDNNEMRTLLQDGDTVIMRGTCGKMKSEGDGQSYRVGFGECRATILPVVPLPSSSSLPLSPKPATAPKPINAMGRYQNLKLYGFWRSSATWRVRIALALKGIPYETISVDLSKRENKGDDYLRINPMGQVPYLVCTDTETGKPVGMSQSVAILNFLEQAFPQRQKLIPSGLLDQSAAWEMVQVINAAIQPLQNVFYLQRFEEKSDGAIQADEEAKTAIEHGLTVLEKIVLARREALGGEAGPYCIGGFAPTVADCCLVPQMYNARRFGVNVAAVCPTLVNIDALCSETPLFRSAHALVQPDCSETELNP